MALSAVRPTLLGGAVLNDVGPVIEPKGIARIRGYVGKLPAPRSMTEAGQILRGLFGAQFPGFTDAHWEKQARGTWREDQGRLVLSYDPNLMKTLEALDLDMPLPNLWPFFEGLVNIPVLAIRGSHSDLLTAETLQRMKGCHPRLTALTAEGQGHAPVIEGDLIGAVAGLVAEAESGNPEPA
jgi:pimeloyl-ACP methyl ester carboxylesterase